VRSTAGRSTTPTPLRIGFIDLIDAAPLIVALERGFFADEGLAVVLERQLGWGNVRDRLTFGQFDAAHALLGMPLFSRIGRDWFMEPLVALMNLGSGGNAITLSRRLTDAGVRSPTSLAQYIRNDPRHEVLAFAHVFSCSMHHYLLRDWLASGGIDPDRDVRLRVFPPNQMAGHLKSGYVEGFCVGEPWNTLARQEGAGEIVAVTTDIVPEHPEKVLAVSQRWLDRNGPLTTAIIRAVLRGCAFCEDERNAQALAELLARPQYLNASREVIHSALTLDQTVAQGPGSVARSSDWRVRSFAPSATFPSKTHPAWLASQMVRWGHLRRDADIVGMARGCAETSFYRAAARSLNVECPATDFPPMRLRGGVFDPFKTATEEPNEVHK
jgi:ABC-type nitrate/sulfonate/bicarbonate transport system substrate-binding protein